MLINLNNYYKYHIRTLITILENSTNGKREWFLEDGVPNYSLTTRTTYPMYSRFYFIKTPKNLRHIYCSIDKEAYLDGYFNGSPQKLMKMFQNALLGKMPRSPRMLFVFDTILQGYFIDVEDIENLEADSLF